MDDNCQESEIKPTSPQGDPDDHWKIVRLATSTVSRLKQITSNYRLSYQAYVVNCIIVGDNGVGKTSAVSKYVTGNCPGENGCNNPGSGATEDMDVWPKNIVLDRQLSIQLRLHDGGPTCNGPPTIVLICKCILLGETRGSDVEEGAS